MKLYCMSKQITGNPGLSQSNIGTGRKVLPMFLKMVNGMRKIGQKLFNFLKFSKICSRIELLSFIKSLHLSSNSVTMVL